jgi:hypothetical protein
MQTLRYPIVMFVITALAVIGIGVGIVAATTNQNVYGPSWGRFTASFPGHVDVGNERLLQRPGEIHVNVLLREPTLQRLGRLRAIIQFGRWYRHFPL